MKSPIDKFFHPHPAPPGFGQGHDLPDTNANFFSQMFFFWLSPMLAVGWTRPLEKEGA